MTFIEFVKRGMALYMCSIGIGPDKDSSKNQNFLALLPHFIFFGFQGVTVFGAVSPLPGAAAASRRSSPGQRTPDRPLHINKVHQTTIKRGGSHRISNALRY